MREEYALESRRREEYSMWGVWCERERELCSMSGVFVGGKCENGYIVGKV